MLRCHESLLGIDVCVLVFIMVRWMSEESVMTACSFSVLWSDTRGACWYRKGARGKPEVG